MKRMKEFFRTVALIFAVVLIYFFIIVIVKSSMRISMEDYLQNTYKRDFQVDRPRFDFDFVIGFHIDANCITTDNGIDVVNEVTWKGFGEEYPIQSDIITADIWSNRAIADFNKTVKQVYGENAILHKDGNFLRLDFEDDEIWFNREYASEIYRYKEYLDKDYEYIAGFAREGKERLAIGISYVVVIDGKINVEKEIERIKKLRENVQSEFNPEEINFGIYFVTSKYGLETYKLKDIELSKDIPSEYGTEGKALIDEGKLIGHIFLFAEKSNKFFDEQIKDEFERITR